MEKDQLSRKLAVILHADVVGSTSLVQKNETLAHERIQDTFRRFSETISSHNGSAHEIRGDALVAEFPKVSDAVSASLAFQAINAIHNEQLSDDLQPVLRIGIAMGEVVIADNTVTGEGVVLAQRLEQLAESGSVCIQGAAYDTLPKRLPFEYENLGEQQIKGFDEPVKVYSVSLRPGSVIPETESLAQPELEALEFSEKPSIAVLPFINMSGDPEQEYFSDGITEDIITDLSRFRMISVIARNSTFTYKKQAVKVEEAAKELGADYVLEGSVRKAGNRIRVTAQLVDGKTANHLWAERYDRDFDDIFDVQDELTHRIVAIISTRIEFDALGRAKRKGPTNMDAYDYVLKGRELMDRRSRTSTAEARNHFERAIELDSEYSYAWTELAGAHMYEWNGGWTESPENSLCRAMECAQKAVLMDQNDGRALLRLGFNHFFNGDLDQAWRLMDRALELNPNDAEALCRIGLCLTFMGKNDEGIERLEQSLQLEPFGNSVTEWYLGVAYFITRRYREAIGALKGSRAELAEVQAWLAAAYAQAGLTEQAKVEGATYLRAALEEMKGNDVEPPASWIEFLAERCPFLNKDDMDHFVDGLRKAGLPK
jgi:adenylate cyclase